MKNLQKAVSFYFFLAIIAIGIQSCCTETFRIVGNGQADVLDLSTFASVDTVRAPFLLNINFEVEVVDAMINQGLISSAYATSCGEVYENKLDVSTLKVSAKQTFDHDQVTIGIDEDFSNLPNLNTQIFDFGQASLQIEFPQAFLDQAIFQSKDYTFLVEVQTDNGLTLSNEVSVFIDL